MNTPYQTKILHDLFAVLRQQENEADYCCKDYLSSEYQRKELEHSYREPNAQLFDSLPSEQSAGAINERWREKICEWAYQVVDHFDFSREVVAISISYLDRFLGTRRVTKKVFQLAAMTCLYLAIKIHERKSLSMDSFAGLSRGFFKDVHIVAMEESILRYVQMSLLSKDYCLATTT